MVLKKKYHRNSHNFVGYTDIWPHKNLFHCYHIYPWLCLLGGCIVIFSRLLHMDSGKAQCSFVSITTPQSIVCVNRKYKDYVYRKMLVQEYLKKWRIFKRVKPKNDVMYHDIYNCICQNTKKIRFIIHYVKPTAQLLFRIRFPKGGPTCRRQVVNPRHQTSQGQSVAKPETPLQNIQVE